MTEFATLGLKVDSRSVDAAGKSLDGLTAKGAKAERATDKLTKSFAGFGRAAKIGIAVGGVAIAAFTTKVIASTKAAEAAARQLEQGLISTGGAVGRSFDELTTKAKELQKATTFDDDAIISGMSKLVTFVNIAGDTFDRTMEAAMDLSTRMDQDLTTSIVQLGKALNDPVKGLSALSRVGVSFTPVQEKMIKNLVESNRLMEAQDIILQELTKEFGGSARAARDTFGGALTGLSNAFDDLFEASDGLDDAKESVESLTSLLQDPDTVAGINSITSAIIKSTAALIRWGVAGVNAYSGLAKAMMPAEMGTKSKLWEQMKEREQLVKSLGDKSFIGMKTHKATEQAIKDLDVEIAKNRELIRLYEELRAPKKATDKKPAAKTAAPGIADAGGTTGKTSIDELYVRASDRVTEYDQHIKDLAETIRGELGTAQTEFAAKVEDADLALIEGAISVDEHTRVMAKYTAELLEATPAIDSLIELEEALTATMTPQEAALRDVREQMLLLNMAMEDFPDKADAIGQAMIRLQAEEKAIIDGTKETADEMSKFAERAAENMQDAFADFLFDPFAEGLDGMLTGFLGVMRRMVAEAAAADLAALIKLPGAGSGGNLSGMLGSLGGMFGGRGTSGDLDKLIGSSDLFSFAGGGFTGNGSRSGGMDGKGGFPAMLHPREVVTDLTKQGGSQSITINVAPAANNHQARYTGQQVANQTAFAIARVQRRFG